MFCDVNVSGDKLRKMRETRGLSQRELGEITGLSVRTICRYESGDTQPDRGKMKLLLEALGEKGQPGNVKRLCPYRTKVTENGGIMFTHCIGNLCMGYFDGKCGLTIGNMQKPQKEKNWFDV